MLKKFNTTETWIDVETLANLKGVSKRAIRLSFNSKNSNYETKIENGKGGKLYKIRLSSIEEELEDMLLVIPENNILQEFKDKISKILLQKHIKECENQKLIQLRDFLLPMLMNGQISIIAE